jgi:hypothetical protein
MSIQTVTLAAALFSSALLGALASNWQKTRSSRKETVAEATKSALRRVEMYYRVLRRRASREDDSDLRDLFHTIQEDNSYFTALLSIESPWLGRSYQRFTAALKKETEPLLQEAWAKSFGPSAELKDKKHPKVQKYIEQFTKDSRRFFNPILRIWMRIKYWLRKYIKDDGYGP